MRSEIDEKARSLLQSRLEKRDEAILAGFRDHVEAIALPTGETRGILDADPAAQNLAKQQSEIGERIARLYEGVRDGDITREKANTEIQRQVDELRSGDLRSRAGELLRRLPRRDFAELERLFTARLNSEGEKIGERLLGIDTGGDHIGGESRFWAKLRQDDDIGVRRDALGDPEPPPPIPPLNVCFGPAHTDQISTSRFDGLAYGSNFALATPSNGRFSCMPTVVVILAGGGAASDQALLIDRVNWNTSFTRMTVTADFTFSLNMMALAIAFSGAGASANLRIDSLFDTGEASTSVSPLGEAIAPIFWFSSVGSSGSRRVVLSTAVNPGARSVTLSAGGAVHTAAFGFSGSFANGILFGNLAQMCVTLS